MTLEANERNVWPKEKADEREKAITHDIDGGVKKENGEIAPTPIFRLRVPVFLSLCEPEEIFIPGS